MKKEKRLKELEESYDSAIINKEEYLKKKKEIEEEKELEEENLKEKEEMKLKEIEKDEKESETLGKGSDKILIIGIFALILIIVAVFFISKKIKDQPKTIEELHQLNFKGKLKPEQGYLYKNIYSFVNLDNFWYTQLTSPSGRRLYNMNFRYSPRDLEDIRIYGFLNKTLFDNATNYYVTFNPVGNDFSHVALAIGDFNQHMANVFGKMPIAACDKNETSACEDRPIINCSNTDEMVLYVKEANNSVVKYDNNCIIIEGNDFDLVKGIDRILYNFYGIMGQ